MSETENSQHDAKLRVSGSLPLDELWDLLNKVHNDLAKSSLPKDEYRSISIDLAKGKMILVNFIKGNDR